MKYLPEDKKHSHNINKHNLIIIDPNISVIKTTHQSKPLTSQHFTADLQNSEMGRKSVDIGERSTSLLMFSRKVSID